MLGRFIIPAERLHELERYKRDLFVTDEKTFRFSVLAGGGTGEKLALDRLREDAGKVMKFLEQHGDAVRVETLELRLPEETFEAGDPSRTADVLREWASAIALEGLPGREVFVEVESRRREEPGVVDQLMHELPQRCLHSLSLHDYSSQDRP